MTTRHTGNFFGTFFAVKMRVVKFGMRVARERCNVADTSQTAANARQEPEVSPEPAEGNVAAGMSGNKLDVIDNKKNDMTDVRKVPVVDVDEGSIVDTSEDEVENSGEDDETIDDGMSVPANDIVSTGSGNKSDNNIRTIPDCSAGVNIATGMAGVTASTDTASSFRIPRKLAGTIPNHGEQTDGWGDGVHFRGGGHSGVGFGRYRGGERRTSGGGGEYQGMRHN